MIRRFVIPAISVLLILSLAACNSSLQVSLPTPTPDTLGEAIQEENSPQTNSGEILFGSLASLESAYVQVYRRVLPSVVSITVARTVSTPQLEFPLDPENQSPDFQQRGAGSGFIWDTEGHIVTNNHVIEGAEIIRVTFSDGTSVLAELIGADASSDLAVLKVDLPVSQLKPMEIMDSTQVNVGQIAIAIGNPFQLSGTMTTGIISGTGRSLALDSTGSGGLYYSIPDIIQTDAAINPGNSGGPLVDIEGRLIGVTTAIESPVRANAGVGYVIPSIIVSKVVPILIKEGDYQQPWIGISGRDLTPESAELMDLPRDQQGALIVEVTPNSPAAKAGLLGSSIEVEIDRQEVLVGGDVIVGVDDQAINDFEDLVAYLARYTLVGQTLNLKIIREGEAVELPLTLEARPGEESSQSGQLPGELGGNAWLGIQSVTVIPEIAEAMGLPAETVGALIQQVSAGSPADEAGLRGSFMPIEVNGEQILIGGDIITAVDKATVDSIRSLSQALSQYEPGDEVTLTILRDGETVEVPVTLAERPSS
jgi:S1-C subfamily serine protease